MTVILYRLKTLPLVAKIFVAAIPVLLFMCMCLSITFVASLGAARRSHPSPAVAQYPANGVSDNPLTTPQVNQAQQVLATIEATQPPSADSFATQTTIAQATQVAFAPFATQTAIITSVGPQ